MDYVASRVDVGAWTRFANDKLEQIGLEVMAAKYASIIEEDSKK